MADKLLIGLDFGSDSVRALLLDEKGRELYVNLETLDPTKERTNAQVQKLVAEKLRHW